MSERKLFVDAFGSITRVALTEDGELAEFMIDTPEDDCRLVGNVYLGRVTNVLEGMQAAFVDIGRERNAFLFVSDMPIDRRDIESEIRSPDRLSVRVGQEIVVQVLKDEVGTKGARVTTNPSLVGRYVVATPTLSFYGISRKIEDSEVRARLAKTLQAVLPEGWGGIARTQSANASKRELRHEVESLEILYRDLTEKARTAKVGELLYGDGDLVTRVARDLVTDDVTTVTTNSPDLAVRLRKYLSLVGLTSVDIILYPSGKDLFGDFDLTRQVNRLLSSRVMLPSGGTLVIDKTEALTVIDVNSGKFVGNSAVLEDTVFAVNLEAANEIARQLRLRNIGGIVVVDFIDMELEAHRKALLEALENALKKDRVKTRIAGMTSLGLVQITRKKTRNEISYYLQEPCPHCGGSGRVVAAKLVVPKAAKLINKAFVDPTVCAVLVSVHPAVADLMARGALSKECETLWQGKRVYVDAAAAVDRETVRLTPFRSALLDLPDTARLLY